jgi:hypothetical protein
LHTIKEKTTLFELMKKLLVFTTLLQTIFSFAQQIGQVTIIWSTKTEFAIGESIRNVPQFQAENFIFDDYKKTLSFCKKIPNSLFSVQKSLKITNLELEIIPENFLGDLDRSKIPSKIEANITSSYARNEIVSTLKVSPIIKEGELYKRVKSFGYNFNTIEKRANTKANNISNSVLANGDWYRFYIEKSGVYKISKSFLSQLGLNTNAIDPRKIKLFGNGGRMLPLVNSAGYPDDLAENAIQLIGEEDGVFNDSDYILFYGEGVDNWNQESETNGNLYEDKSYYYITTSGNVGKRIQTALQPASIATQIITEFDDTLFYEVDKVNIIKLGRTWFGDDFGSNNIQEFSFSIPNIVTPSNITINTHTATLAPNTTSFKVEANGTLLGTITANKIGSQKGFWII